MRLNKISKVIIGTTITKLPTYILEEFFSNQKEIQEKYPDSELVISTSDDNFRIDVPRELKCKIIKYQKPVITDADIFTGNKIRILDM